MIVKSYVIDNGFLKVLTTLDDTGIKTYAVEKEIKTPVLFFDVVKAGEKSITLSVNGKEEVEVSLVQEEAKKIEPKKEEEPVVVVTAEPEEEPVVVIEKSVHPKTNKKAGKK